MDMYRDFIRGHGTAGKSITVIKYDAADHSRGDLAFVVSFFILTG